MPVSISTEKCGQVVPGWPGRRTAPSFQRRRRVGHFDVVACLDGPGVRQELVLRPASSWLPTPSSGAFLAGEQTPTTAQVDDGILRRALRLAVEEVGDGGHGVELELLIGVELELHSVAPYTVLKLVTPLVLKICTALALSWSLPAKPSSRQTTRSGFCSAMARISSSVSASLQADEERATGHAVDGLARQV